MEQNDGVFYFESDHLALRGNVDYQNALRHIACLEVLRSRLHKQVEELIVARNHYAEHPDELISKLRKNEPIVDPSLNTTEKIPEIDFEEILSKYNVADIKPPNSSSLEPPKVRGRIVDETKPETFNQLWTDEEQKRLEELLIQFPPEEKEMRRFTKIAKALGNRTTLQVASRVQKYFQKLHEAGLPIPGRIPKNRRLKQGSRLKSYQKPSTFFPHLNVPVEMPEDDDFLEDAPVNPSEEIVLEEEPMEIDADEKTLTTESDSKKLKLFIFQKIRDEKMFLDNVQVEGAPKCEICKTEPVSRLQWSCLTCYRKLKLCSDCLIDQLVENQFPHITHNVILEKS